MLRTPSHEPVEEARIVRAGGYIYGGRVNGNCVRSCSALFLLPVPSHVPLISFCSALHGGSACAGNLALSRAIGDFAFKTNPTLPAEEQMVTGTCRG